MQLDEDVAVCVQLVPRFSVQWPCWNKVCIYIRVEFFGANYFYCALLGTRRESVAVTQ